MRARTRQAVGEAVAASIDGALGRLADLVDERSRDAMASRNTHTSLIEQAIREVQPASVDLTQELADDIVRKIRGPLTISAECSAWLRSMAEFKDVFLTYSVGYGPTYGALDMRIKTDGALCLDLRDANGATMWTATLVPPDYGQRP